MMKINFESKENIPEAVRQLRDIFQKNREKRICVVGASCSGKTTLLKFFPEAVDMDDLLFGSKEKGLPPLLTQQEIDYVCGPWQEEVGKFMMERAKEHIRITPGQPVFGTIVFPSDLIVEIIVPEALLKERIAERGAAEEDVLHMRTQIEREIQMSGIETIVIENL